MPRIRPSSPQPKDDPLGLICPRCGGQQFRVLYLQRRTGGVLLRRRECRHCGRRVSTQEVIVG